MAVAAQLFRLEQLDAELDRLAAARADVQRRQQHDGALAAAEAQVARDGRDLERARAEQRALERDLAELETRIARDNDRMYGGRIVDPRELGSLERELQHHRARRDEIEETVLAAMERVESLESDLNRHTRELEERRERRSGEAPELERRAESLDAELRALRAQRDDAAAAVDARSLALYDRLRSSTGHAVSVASGGVCQWCRVTIPSKDVQHARSTLVTCGNCGRVLYVGA